MRLALVPLGFAFGGILCRVWLGHPAAAYAVDLAQPLAVVTYWQHFGSLMWLALFAAVAIASVGYIGALGRSTVLTTTTVFSALACGAALTFPVVFSSDVYAYAGYGWLALHGLNPYAHAAMTARNPLLDAVVWQWGNPPPVCVYGPAFVWFSQALVAAFGSFGPAAILWAFRVAACVALVCCAPLAYAAFPERTRAAAAAGIALNPIAIWSCAEGHNDVYVLAIALGGFALIARSRVFTGAVLLALSAVVKIPGALAAGAALVAYARDARFARVLGGTLAGAAICALAGWDALAQLSAGAPAPAHHYFPQFSLQYVFSLPFGPTVGIALTAALVVACVIAAAIQVWNDNPGGLAALAFALWIAIPNPYPWYALWILPLAFVCSGAGRGALVTLTLASVLRYLPDSIGDVSAPIAVAVALVPLGAAALAFILCRRSATAWVTVRG